MLWLRKTVGRISDWDWRWWVGKTVPSAGAPQGGDGFQNNMVWVGDVHQGMRIKLLGDGADWYGALPSSVEWLSPLATTAWE
jgi:hypothetical protein